jgi:hypothetical protein
LGFWLKQAGYSTAAQAQAMRGSASKNVPIVPKCFTCTIDCLRKHTSARRGAVGNRRMTRLTNAFSKKVENHVHMMAIYFMHYNFVRHPSNAQSHASYGRWRDRMAFGRSRIW